MKRQIREFPSQLDWQLSNFSYSRNCCKHANQSINYSNKNVQVTSNVAQ